MTSHASEAEVTFERSLGGRQRAVGRALATRAAAARLAAHHAAAVVGLDDVELLLDHLVGEVEQCATAMGAGVGSEDVLLDREVCRERLAPGRPGCGLRLRLARWELGGLRAPLVGGLARIVEGLRGGWCRRLRRAPGAAKDRGRQLLEALVVARPLRQKRVEPRAHRLQLGE